MQQRFRTAGILGALILGAGPARADRAFLVGGTVVEGKVSRHGDRVTIEVGSGTIALPADSVARIEKSESPVERFEARYAALKTGDVAARLSLADYCRDHDMAGRERQLLQEILEIDANHAQARARLGYVKTESGWATQADVNREKGLVQQDGRWIPAAEAAQIERQRAEAAAESARRDESEEIEGKRRQLAAERADLDAERIRDEARRESLAMSSYYYPYYYSFYTPFYGVPFGQFHECLPGRPCARPPHVARQPGPFDTTTLSVVKVPYRHSR